MAEINEEKEKQEKEFERQRQNRLKHDTNRMQKYLEDIKWFSEDYLHTDDGMQENHGRKFANLISKITDLALGSAPLGAEIIRERDRSEYVLVE